MSRLLRYLIERSLEGVPVKSYRIATEALGRAEDDGADADTYARVAVARLRRALASYYADHPDQDEIYVDTRSYTVQIREKGEAGEAPEGEPEGAPPAPAPLQAEAPGRKRVLRLALAGLVLAALAAGAAYYMDWRDKGRWTQTDFPTLVVIGTDKKGGVAPPERPELDAFGNVLRTTLAEYFGFRQMEPGRVRADYEIRLDADRSGEAGFDTLSLIETASQRVVWTRQYPAAAPGDPFRNARMAAAAIAAPGGALARFGRRKGLEPWTPYGCWLRFTGSVMSYSSRSDSDLQRCARDWYAADEDSRVAGFLRNWTMVDASLTTLGDDRRQAELQEALDVIHHALARNPESAMLYVGEMRTYSFLGMDAEVRQSARAALDAAPGNRVIAGMAGTWLAFWNDPQGKEVLAGLEQDPEVNLPWEHAGFFVAAMMDDDVAEAGRHLSNLRFYLDDQPALALLEAAHARRTGRRRAAEVALDRIRNRAGGWIAGPDEVLERMPLAPVVKARMEQWLAYGGTAAAAN
ncbi:hypothetical protein [Alteraurantiacibacter buctensis]|uniref:Tetratricopeptide repeat protein n=1 Tax=Alteraurantiacibacter buctensis TaxID=1503981 RepID=A0A844YZ94_9SPHN|nr:hypothetical protein [Alteraurantiacibacter buctensis]MXO72502.1 hypothetical protein [Alteraurantiacibacter buctensis]